MAALTVPEYGVMQLSELIHDFPEAIGIMQRAIKATLATHEPRLKNVQVRHIKEEGAPSGMALEFEISAVKNTAQ